VIDQPVLATRGQIGVQQPEIRDAARIGDHDFAVQDQVLRRECHERIGDWLDAQCPVVAPPCVDGRLSASQLRLRAVAVELDLVNQRSSEGAFSCSAGRQGSMKPGDSEGLARAPRWRSTPRILRHRYMASRAPGAERLPVSPSAFPSARPPLATVGRVRRGLF
jgi:hypothetical protein